jgi:hypothetical protein
MRVALLTPDLESGPYLKVHLYFPSLRYWDHGKGSVRDQSLESSVWDRMNVLSP